MCQEYLAHGIAWHNEEIHGEEQTRNTLSLASEAFVKTD